LFSGCGGCGGTSPRRRGSPHRRRQRSPWWRNRRRDTGTAEPSSSSLPLLIRVTLSKATHRRSSMSDSSFDLLIRAGRVVNTTGSWDGPGAVAVRGERIAAVGSDVPGPARVTWEFPDAILLPGLIDLHAHPAREGSIFGVDPDRECFPHGVTTVLS